jgi:hypothetical protein
MLAAAAACVYAYDLARPTLPRIDFVTGWVLAALALFLTAYNARKKLPFLPLVGSRVWLVAHTWVGLLAAVVFGLHLRWRMPHGQLEAILAALFVGVTLSGLAGWWLSRAIPIRLTGAGGEVPYERIPVVLRSLRERAETLVVAGIPAAASTTLAEFYTARVSPFFAGPANFAAHIMGSRRALNTLLEEIREINKYLNPLEKSSAIELAALVREKDTLDLHRAMQLTLRGWLFVHIPLTYGMIVFGVIHAVFVYAYSGGAR